MIEQYRRILPNQQQTPAVEINIALNVFTTCLHEIFPFFSTLQTNIDQLQEVSMLTLTAMLTVTDISDVSGS